MKKYSVKFILANAPSDCIFIGGIFWKRINFYLYLFILLTGLYYYVVKFLLLT